MARMIPPTFSGKTTSPGEKQLFQRLKEDPNTSEWIVLHSLDIAHHIRQIEGEADFVVIVPSKGILCVEVKSHTHIQRDPAGYWYLGRDSTPEQRGPFKQASEAMHSLRTRLFAQYPQFKNLVFWSCVVFTHTPFNVSSDEWHSWQVIDTNLFNSKPVSFLLENILDQARDFLTTCTTATWFKPNLNIPSPADCLEIAQALRPSFEFFESPESRERHLRQELKEYTEEQFLALERMAANPRVIFEGPAGTGKTLLAIEAARRAIESGLKVLLLCYNSLLGGWLEKQTLSLNPQLTTRTLHKHMLRVWGESVPEKPTRVFWEEELPAHALNSLKNDSNSNHHYDLIIVDEAQDILRETYLRFLDKTLNNGLSKGKWLFFGDFEKQAIYSAATLHVNDFREHWGNYAPVYSLRASLKKQPAS
jgi:ATP:corrinoid adenosyltransferase